MKPPPGPMIRTADLRRPLRPWRSVQEAMLIVPGALALAAGLFLLLEWLG
jgi:hypothetical protein